MTYFLIESAKVFEKGLFRWMSSSDPIVVSIILFVVFSPVALIYLCVARAGVTKLVQIKIEKKNILYVTAHPDDEAM